jgi:hypothetical protein
MFAKTTTFAISAMLKEKISPLLICQLTQ